MRARFAAKEATPHKQSDSHDQAPPVRRTPAAPLVVGPADDAAEREADHVAADVLARLHGELDEGAGAHEVRRSSVPGSAEAEVGYAGGALSDHLTERIEKARTGGSALASPVRRRMEDAFGSSLGDVRIHDGGEAAALNRSISASAFTSGRDIFFGAGQYRPDTPAGERVLAHEIAHTRQQGRSVGRTVQRRLAGTADAMQNLGGERTSNKKRRAFRILTNWDKILLGLREYEALEAKLGGAPSMPVFAKAKPRLVKKLRAVDKSTRTWHEKNEQEANEKLANDAHAASKESGEGADADPRTKAGRRQAIGLLEPRLGNELNLLGNADPSMWMKSMGLNPDTLVKSGRSDAGQKNTVQEQKFKSEAGKFKGFFKQDVGFAKEPEAHELDVGIRQVDPRYGARAVAMYKLDQLLNAGVTARAEFAIGKDAQGKSVLGTVLESAKGTSAGSTKVGVDRQNADALGPGAISLEDPVLQRGLNKLQILDAICGQLDRHAGNYFIQADNKGNVTGVTGIDLDMAFGADMESHDSKAAKFAQNYKGLPEVIDEEMGKAILRITGDDIAAALTGLLPAKEVAATVKRFESVRAVVEKADKAGALRADWNAQTATERPNYNDLGFAPKKKNYFHEMAFGARINQKARIGSITADTIRGGCPKARLAAGPIVGRLDQLPPEILDGLVYLTVDGGGFAANVAEYAMDNRVPPEQLEELVGIALSVYVQPSAITPALKAARDAADTPRVAAALAQVLGNRLGSEGMSAVRARFESRGTIKNAMQRRRQAMQGGGR
jgi:hypothetical protein